LKDALNNINPAALVDLSWETKYYPVHGLGTSSLGGYKLGSTRGLGDQQFCVGILDTSIGKQIIPPPIVTVSWKTEPTNEVLTGLSAAIDVSQLYHRNGTFRTDAS